MAICSLYLFLWICKLHPFPVQFKNWIHFTNHHPHHTTATDILSTKRKLSFQNILNIRNILERSNFPGWVSYEGILHFIGKWRILHGPASQWHAEESYLLALPGDTWQCPAMWVWRKHSRGRRSFSWQVIKIKTIFQSPSHTWRAGGGNWLHSFHIILRQLVSGLWKKWEGFYPIRCVEVLRHWRVLRV